MGTERDFEIAEKLFRSSLNKGNLEIEYYVNTFEKLKNRKIKAIKSFADDIENDLDGILILPDKNIDVHSNTLYCIETFDKIKKQIEVMLEGIPKVKEDRTNEFEVFELICKKIAKSS